MARQAIECVLGMLHKDDRMTRADCPFLSSILHASIVDDNYVHDTLGGNGLTSPWHARHLTILSGACHHSEPLSFVLLLHHVCSSDLDECGGYPQVH